MATLVSSGKATDLNLNAMPMSLDVWVYRGDYVDFYFTLNDDSGAPRDVTGWVSDAHIKQSYDDPEPVAVFECTPTGEPGEIRGHLSSEESSKLAAGSYVWDFQIIKTGETDARTYVAGKVNVRPDVTRVGGV